MIDHDNYNQLQRRVLLEYHCKNRGPANARNDRQPRKHFKENATKTHSTLSDGVHGHLGLVLSPQAYALISDAPYVQPQLPAPLVIPAQTTQVQAANLKDIHSRVTSLFFEVQQVKSQLIDLGFSGIMNDNSSNTFNSP